MVHIHKEPILYILKNTLLCICKLRSFVFVRRVQSKVWLSYLQSLNYTTTSACTFSASKTYPEHVDGQLNLNQLGHMSKLYILDLLQELISLRRKRFKIACDLILRQIRGGPSKGATMSNSLSPGHTTQSEISLVCSLLHLKTL